MDNINSDILEKSVDYNSLQLQSNILEKCVAYHDLRTKRELLDNVLSEAYCSYGGMCMADKEKCYECSDYVISYRDVMRMKEALNE